jgi:hypothetical protein
MVSAEHRGCLLPESSPPVACIITSSILHGIIEKNTLTYIVQMQCLQRSTCEMLGRSAMPTMLQGVARMYDLSW